MNLYKIYHLIQDVRFVVFKSYYYFNKIIYLMLLTYFSKNSCKCCMNIYTKSNFKILINKKLSKTYTSNVSTSRYKDNSWYSFIKQRKWIVPFGMGVTLLTALQWRHLKKHPYTTEDSNVYDPINVFVV